MNFKFIRFGLSMRANRENEMVFLSSVNFNEDMIQTASSFSEELYKHSLLLIE